MRSAYVCIAIVTLAASSAWSIGAALPQAPIGHRQPTVKDLPPDVARDERPADASRGEQQSAPLPEKNVRARAGSPARGQNVRASAGGPPTLPVGPSCDAAARGSVVLGRDKKACLADETTAQDTLKQNWSKYAAADKSECIGMVTTGGPASYVELLSCVEILRDARNIRNADALETNGSAISRFRRSTPREQAADRGRRTGRWSVAATPTDPSSPQGRRECSILRVCHTSQTPFLR
jgi:hypothetical protein